jgi:hypothetical protein
MSTPTPPQDTPETWEMKWKIAVEMGAQAQNERDRLATLLCRVQMPMPANLVARLCSHFGNQYPEARLQQTGNHLEIFEN